jgi:DNA-binding NarL/FixJ family response regulator
MEVVGQAADAVEAVEQALVQLPDIVLLDVRMPGDGLRALAEIKRRLPQVRVLVLSQYEDPDYLRRALACGASGYLLKRGGGLELLQAIRSVRDGGIYLDPSLARHVVEGIRRDPGPPAASVEQLSKRERQVLRCLALGMTSQQISEALAIGVRTVETYKERLAEKLGLKGRAALVRYAIESGLLDAPDLQE